MARQVTVRSFSPLLVRTLVSLVRVWVFRPVLQVFQPGQFAAFNRTDKFIDLAKNIEPLRGGMFRHALAASVRCRRTSPDKQRCIYSSTVQYHTMYLYSGV